MTLTDSEIEAKRSELRLAAVEAARALLDFEGIAAFCIFLKDTPAGQAVLAAGTESAVRELAGGMTEARAREFFANNETRFDEPGLALSGGYAWIMLPEEAGALVELGGRFAADDLEAIAWWMRNKKVTP